MSFDISKFAEGFGVSDPDTSGPDRIEYIDLDRIDGDPDNGYSLADIEQLADNIQTVGLLQPLRLRPGTDGRYVVSSGHRRRLALRRLVQDGDERFSRVPCIVDRDGASPALQELRLLYGNANNRAKTSADLAQEARRVEALLVRLKGEGFQFRGRTRTMVAQLLQVSETRVANAQAIERGLKDPQLIVWWQTGELSEAAALEAARMTPEEQASMGLWMVGNHLKPSLGNVREFSAILPQIDHVCKLAGEPCPNARAMYQHFCRGGSWEGCAGCCDLCLKRDTCEVCCQYVERREPAAEPVQAPESIPEPVPAPEPPEQQLVLAGWMPGGVDPSEPGLFAAVLDLDGKPVKRLLRWQGGKWVFEHVTTEINVPVLWWLRLPPVPGEEETC